MEKPTRFHWLHVVSTLTFLAFAIVLFADFATLLQNAVGSTPLVIALMVTPIIGYILADFASGFVHFMGDTFGNARTPIIGKAFIFPFREHHVDPKAMTRHHFFVTNGNNCLVSLPVMALMHWPLFGWALGRPWLALVFSTLLFLVMSVFFTNQIHKWAHEDNPNAIARWLQKHGVILAPTRHKLHHTPPFRSDYCITTGWLNPLLRKTHFFPLAKKILSKVPFMPKADERSA